MEITPAEIKTAYTKAFKVSWLAKMLGVFQLTNLKYNPLNWDEVAEIIAIDQTNRMEWKYNEYEKFTCADFSYSLMGAFHRYQTTAAMPIFICWVITPQGGHSVLSFYDEGQIFLIEPQNDEVFSPPKDWTLKLLNG